MSAFAPTISLPSVEPAFDPQGTAMVPVSVSGANKKLGTIEIKSPMEQVTDFFASIDQGIQDLITVATKDYEDSIPDPQKDDFAGVETDGPKKETNIEAFKGSALKGLLDTLKDSFDKISFGEKMTAILLTGGLLLFTKFKDQLKAVLIPVIEGVQGMIETFGAGGTFAIFLATFLAFKTGLAQWTLMWLAGASIKGLNKTLSIIKKNGGLFNSINIGVGKIAKLARDSGKFITRNLTRGFGKLRTGIELMNKGVANAVKAVGGGMTRLMGAIGKGFTAIRLGMIGMKASMLPMLAPLAPIIAIAAAVAAVFYSLKSGFDVFKKSLEDGDSMFTAVLKGLGDAMLTLITLPQTLVKKLVGWIAGLLGFDDFKKKLEEFSFKDMIKNAFVNFTSGMVRVIKAIAKGAAAALAALAPGGGSPAEAYQRVYQEVMSSGNDSEDVATTVNTVALADKDTSTEAGDAAAAESFYANQRAIEEGDMHRGRHFTSSMATIAQGTVSEVDMEENKKGNKMMLKLLEFQHRMLELELEKKKNEEIEKEKNRIIQVNANKGATTVNQQQNTNITGDLAIDHSELTQKHLHNIA